MTEVVAPLPETGVPAPTVVGAPPGGRPWRAFRHNRSALLGLLILAVITLAVVLGPELSPYDVVEPNIAARLRPPTLAHPMGTDELGRDILTRIFAGGRLSLVIGLAATVVALSIGVLVGAVAGYVGRAVDNVLMRVVDVALSLPDLFLLILASSLLGPSLGTMIVVIAIVRWMNVARLVRASFLSLREREFIEAARAAGGGGAWIVTRHLLPNSLSPIIVAGTLGVASAIIAESTLSFLGLGIQPPATSWGSMLRNAQAQIFTSPWMAVFPGLMIFLTVLAINLVGDGLRDALDPGSARAFRGRRDEIRAALLREAGAGVATVAVQVATGKRVRSGPVDRRR